MPKRFLFFCGKSNSAMNNVIISKAFESQDDIPLDKVVRQCEAVFGVATRKLPDAESSLGFALFNTTGFRTIYGITRKSKINDDFIMLNVTNLDELNEFLLADTIEQKKSLFLWHCLNYVGRVLKNDGIDRMRLTNFSPILEYVAQQFHLASNSLLHDGQKPILKGEKRDNRISRLAALGHNVTALLHIAMDLESLKEPTETNLKGLLEKYVQNLEIPVDCDARVLGYGLNRKTQEEAICDTLKNFHGVTEISHTLEEDIFSTSITC